LRDAESKYHSHFSQSPLVFPKIEGVNAGSDCFDVLGRPTLGLSGTKLYKNQSSGPNNNIQKVSMSNNLFLSLFLMKIFFYTEKSAILKVYFRKSLITQL
jgi:hypothetical protein